MGAGLKIGGVGTCGDRDTPCFDCCDADGQRTRARTQTTMRTLREPGYEVELAVSPLAGLKGAAGYHSSILVAGEEYWFSTLGIMHSPNISSHKKNPHMQRLFIGLSKYSGADLVEFFDHHFPPGHYDLLRKNCNSFSDCALYFLCEQRLSLKYRTMELFGKLADDHAGVIQSISAGEYVPNPQALAFEMEAILAEIDTIREYEMASEMHLELPHATIASAPRLQEFENKLTSLSTTRLSTTGLSTPPGRDRRSSTAESRDTTEMKVAKSLPNHDFMSLPEPEPPIEPLPVPGSSDLSSSGQGENAERFSTGSPDPLGVTRNVVTLKRHVKLPTWEELRAPPPMLQASPPVAAPPASRARHE